MVAFRVVQPVAAPPEFVVDWWLDYSDEDPELTTGIVRRKVERLDDRRVHLSTTSEFGGRERTTDGVVTRTGPVSWEMEGRVLSSDRVVSSMRSTYTVERQASGSRVIADFEFVGRSLGWRLAIALSSVALRRRQRATFRDYAAAIEREFAAHRSGPALRASAGSAAGAPLAAGGPAQIDPKVPASEGVPSGDDRGRQ